VPADGQRTGRVHDAHGVATRETDLVGAGRTLGSTNVSSISSHSPLEIVLWLGSGITAGTVAAQRLVRLFNAYQDARVHKAGADLQVEIRRGLRDRVARAGMSSSGSRTEARLNEVLAGAATALALIERLELLDGEHGGTA
jgi:hypothetical protein